MAILLVKEIIDYNLQDDIIGIKNCNNCQLYGDYYTLCSYHEGWVDGIDTKFTQISKIMDKERGINNVN